MSRDPADSTRRGPRGVTARFLDAILALAIIGAVDIALFHAGLYVRVLKPQSYSGRVERDGRRLLWSIEHHPTERHIVVMGDSTTANAVDESVLDQELASAGAALRSINLAEGGATPNAWLPLLRSQPIDRRTTRIAVLGLFLPSLSVGEDPRPDIEIAKTRISIGDAIRLSTAYRSIERRLSVASGAFLRLPWYRDDVRDFLRSPRRRLRQVAGHRRLERRYEGSPRRMASAKSLASVHADPEGRVSFASAEAWIQQDEKIQEGIRQRVAWQRAILRHQAPLPPQDPGYLRSLERLARLLHGRGVAVVWALVPESPYPTGMRELGEAGELRARLCADGIDVAVFRDLDLLIALEQPRYYGDHMHLNQEGSRIYTRALARFLGSRPR